MVIIDIIQIASAVILIIVVLMQNRGTGVGGVFGGGGEVHQTKRGSDKVLFNLTIILAIIFFVSAFINILL